LVLEEILQWWTSGGKRSNWDDPPTFDLNYRAVQMGIRGLRHILTIESSFVYLGSSCISPLIEFCNKR
jgi:hypothetical protein